MKSTPEFVTVTVNGEKRSIARGTRLSELLDLALPCGGHGKCGKCKVIATGELSPLSDSEKRALSAEELAAATDSDVVCVVGTKFVLYRQSSKEKNRKIVLA